MWNTEHKMGTSKELLLLCVLCFIITRSSLVSGTACGRVLQATDTPQYLKSPGYPDKYSPNISCWWNLVANDSSKVIVLETAVFMLHAGAKCDEDQDRLSVFNENTHNLLVGYTPDTSEHTTNLTLRGQDRRRIISHGKSLFLFFTSDGQYEDKGFKLRYYQAPAKTTCNFDFVASFFRLSFSSPGYPGGYFSNLECNYTIRTDEPDSLVQIDIDDSDIEDSARCQYDRLTIVDQNNGNEQILGTICGKETSGYQSSGNSLRIQFVSNSHKVNKGFSFSYRSVSTREKLFVSSPATRMESFIVSPGYPHNHYSNLFCMWSVFNGDRTTDLSVVKSNIAGYGPNCTGNKLVIVNPSGPNQVLCANQTPSFEISDSVFIALITDGVTENQGFRARYRLQQENFTIAPCGGKLEADSSRQTLQSPLYPDTRLVYQHCVWNLTAAEPDKFILIVLEDLDIEMSSKCVYDSLRIYNGNVEDGNILETWCGQRGGEVIYNTGLQLTIVYKMDDSNNGRGFSLTYSEVSESSSVKETSHLIAKDSVSYLTSPGYSNYFPRNRVFSYTFTADEGKKIRLGGTRSSLSLRSNGTCTGDTQVIVYDGPTNTAPRLPSFYSRYFTWCGEDRPLYVSSNNSMLLEYYTGSQGDKDVGFELTYQQGSYDHWRYHVCGGWLQATATPKRVTSLSYPYFNSNNKLCRWVIHASTNGSMVRLTAADLSHPGILVSDTCAHDSTTVYDGGDDPGNRKEVWCGPMGKIFQTTGSVLTIVFRTDSHLRDAGSRLEYFETTDSASCVQSFTATSYNRYLKTPGYDQQILPPNTTCTWMFSRNMTHLHYIMLNVTSLAGGVTNNRTCSSNRIDVYDGMSGNSPLIARFCGGDKKSYIGSKATMLVKMLTGPNPIAKGFKIAYSSEYGRVCGDKYLSVNLSDSILKSPFYPTALYPNNMDCIWYLDTSDSDYIVKIEVLETDVEYSEGCVNDYIEVYDAFGTFSPIDKWCGTQTPQFQSTGDTLTIKFHTDSSVSKSGFKLKYWKLLTAKNPTSYSGQRNHDTNEGAIIGGTIGGIALAVIIIIVIAVYLFHKSMHRRPVLTTAVTCDPQMVYQTGTNTVPMNQQSAGPNIQAYTNNACSGVGNSYIASPNTVDTGFAGVKSPLPEYSSLATGNTNPHHYGVIQSGTQATEGTMSNLASDNNGNYSASYSTKM